MIAGTLAFVFKLFGVGNIAQWSFFVQHTQDPEFNSKPHRKTPDCWYWWGNRWNLCWCHHVDVDRLHYATVREERSHPHVWEGNVKCALSWCCHLTLPFFTVCVLCCFDVSIQLRIVQWSFVFKKECRLKR